MNKTKIEWCDYTWNPVVGCKRGCSYCYAKKMNDRFRWLSDFKELQYYPKRRTEPSKVKTPSKIFVGSMSDIAFWDNTWINNILVTCMKCDWHEFMFLTKSPSVYGNWNFSKNCWLGVTAEIPQNEILKSYIENISHLNNKTFVSIEPLLGTTCKIPKEIDLIIVGAMTGPKAIKPKPEWIQSIKDNVPEDKIFWKKNIRKYL